MSEVAKAYIQLVPSASGIKGAIEKELGGEVDAAGASAGAGFSKAFGGALAGIGKVVTGALAAGAAAAGKLAKDAVAGFADYEQLVGGVETLFKDSADVVKQYAAEAYQTAGLSANQYMETVTGFSASLLQSLGGDTAKAAEAADVAIRDMADNANKMGTSMESIQNAYQGFAKQNYTMLDNLKLGYGGTKEEMERLLEDAEQLSGVEYDISNLSDVYEAIHVIQTELGITGTTAKEASETISGSVAAMKSAWDNLIVGLADDNADLDALIGNVVDSAETAIGNIMPAVEKALGGIADLIEKLAPIIAEKLPELVTTILPPLIEAAASIVQGLAEALPEILGVLIEIAPGIINTIVATVIELLPQIVELGLQLIIALAMGIAENIDELIPALAQAIEKIVEILTEPETLTKLIGVGIELVLAIGAGLIEAIPYLLDALGELLGNLLTTVAQWGAAFFKAVADVISEIAKMVWDTIKGLIQSAFQWGVDLIKNFVDGILSAFKFLWDILKEIGQAVKDFLGFSEPKKGPLSNFHTFAPDMIDLWVDGIERNLGNVESAASLFAETIDRSVGSTMTTNTGAISALATPSSFNPAPDNTADAFASLVSMQNTAQTRPINVTLELDSQILARTCLDAFKAEDHRRGPSATT